ncbi:MAG: transcription repressor NadR [Thermaerobacter sp.]|nr:transcription repressor NadR [Thermaerobacter sp.]
MRRQQLLHALETAKEPLSGTYLADLFGVSRQVIVQDVALLRAEGHSIESTMRGYRIARPSLGVRDAFGVRHGPEATELELGTLVDLGIAVIDVVVYHPIYGELHGGLDLRSRRDVAQFMERLREERTMLLSALTHGAHVHTVEARDRETLSAGRSALRELGMLDEG